MRFEDELAVHADDMWALARRLCGDEALDVVQEASEQAWRTRNTFDASRGSRRTWLLMIVADRARKHHRRRRRTVPLSADYPQPSTDHDQHLDVSHAIAALPQRQRLAVELHYVLGLTVAEAAEAMRCTPGTVKSTLSDARRNLRTSVEVRG
ncbi:MAG: hypothetical protein QOJ79_3618 [Actinomycetota bacterium]|nr:hypothetical protein [Actinomycetota bacterium]